MNANRQAIVWEIHELSLHLIQISEARDRLAVEEAHVRRHMGRLQEELRSLKDED